MKYILAIFITAVISYLLGSCNSAIITVKLLKNKDIRECGSGNAGLTNTLRCFGKLPALITLIGDLAKGVIAVFICRYISILLNCGIGSENDVRYIGYIAGFFAVIGHIFPLYYGFKGGKGVLVGVSVYLVIDPVAFIILILIFSVVLIISRYVSLSSIIAAVCNPFITFYLYFFARNNSLKFSLIYALLTLPVSIIIIYMHRSNIERLRTGNENKFKIKK